jgi:catechol 2,3-dioxygenase-like lactoylglutathione lyase family enzyme
MQPVKFDRPTPIIHVRDLAASIDYYVRILGFQAQWSGPNFASIVRDRCHLFLADGDQGNPGSWTYCGVGDAEALHAEYLASGAKIRQGPTNHAWALEMQVEDIDGNVLRMGSDPKEDQPLGDWLDMRGILWQPTPDGGWTRVN